MNAERHRSELVDMLAGDIGAHHQSFSAVWPRNIAVLLLDSLERLGYTMVPAGEATVTRSYWVVNEETGGIGYSVDYTDFDALGRAEHWQSVFGPGHRIDLVTHRHWATPSEQVSRETVVPALAAAGKD